MPEENRFADFLRRIRAGDNQAAAELVRQFEPLIRTEVRMRPSDPRLYRLFDSMDICQLKERHTNVWAVFNGVQNGFALMMSGRTSTMR